MKYQDIWRDGELIQAGVRSCAPRYKIIKEFCRTKFPQGGFSVLDIGANMCYFGIRLIEYFNCTVFAFEFHQYIERNAIIKKNKLNNLIYINRKLDLNDLLVFNKVMKFDVVLAMSVLHHVSEPLPEWINAIRKISKFSIIELAKEDSVRASKRNNYSIPNDYTVIGAGKSHLKKDFERKIITFNGY